MGCAELGLFGNFSFRGLKPTDETRPVCFHFTIRLRPNDGSRDLDITIPAADQCGLTTGLIDLELLKVDAAAAVSGGIYGIAPDDFADVPMRIRFDVGGTLYFLNFNRGESGPCKNKSGFVRVDSRRRRYQLGPSRMRAPPAWRSIRHEGRMTCVSAAKR